MFSTYQCNPSSLHLSHLWAVPYGSHSTTGRQAIPYEIGVPGSLIRARCPLLVLLGKIPNDSSPLTHFHAIHYFLSFGPVLPQDQTGWCVPFKISCVEALLLWLPLLSSFPIHPKLLYIYKYNVLIYFFTKTHAVSQEEQHSKLKRGIKMCLFCSHFLLFHVASPHLSLLLLQHELTDSNLEVITVRVQLWSH